MEPTKPDGAGPGRNSGKVLNSRIYVLRRHLVDSSPGPTVLFEGPYGRNWNESRPLKTSDNQRYAHLTRAKDRQGDAKRNDAGGL